MTYPEDDPDFQYMRRVFKAEKKNGHLDYECLKTGHELGTDQCCIHCGVERRKLRL